MIEINLLPEELRNRAVKPAGQTHAGSPFKYDSKQPFIFIPLILLFVLCANIFFALRLMSVNLEIKSLNKRWTLTLPERNELAEFKSQDLLVSSDSKDLERLLRERVTWADKLNTISLLLPPGIWLESVYLAGKDFKLIGKAVSLNRTEVSMVRSLIDGLKENKRFIKDFTLFELNAIEKSLLNNRDTVDFGISGKVR